MLSLESQKMLKIGHKISVMEKNPNLLRVEISLHVKDVDFCILKQPIKFNLTCFGFTGNCSNYVRKMGVNPTLQTRYRSVSAL